jgi:ABC-type lipoprotein export system ATPase subunit
MVKKPPIILADEPTGNLDNRTGEQILGLLHDQCRALNTTLIMASHSGLTARHTDRTLQMIDGAVMEMRGVNGVSR